MGHYIFKKKPLSTLEDLGFVGELNNIFLRFETQTEQYSRPVICPLTIFWQICMKEASGPDGKSTSENTSKRDWHQYGDLMISQKSVYSHTIPNNWRTHIISSAPPQSCPKVKNDFRPVALTPLLLPLSEHSEMNWTKILWFWAGTSASW